MNNSKLIYSISITGPIGVGKSTLINNIIVKLQNLYPDKKIAIIKEYIDYDQLLGQTLLNRFIDGKISNASFQNYILDTYEEQMKNNTDADILIFERTLDDSVICFANIVHSEGKISDLDLLTLQYKVQNLDKKFNIPNYYFNTEFLELLSSNQEDTTNITINKIMDDIEKGVKCRIIGLNIDLTTSKYRIQMRNRDNEDKYEDSYLMKIIKYYNSVYEVLKKGKHPSITTIGSYIEDC